jgi:hypothetical protein
VNLDEIVRKVVQRHSRLVVLQLAAEAVRQPCVAPVASGRCEVTPVTATDLETIVADLRRLFTRDAMKVAAVGILVKGCHQDLDKDEQQQIKVAAKSRRGVIVELEAYRGR